MGSWVRYANQLEPLRQAFLKYVPGLRKKGALVYPDSINWDCLADWDYAAAEAAAKNEEVYVGESSRSLLGRGDDEDEGVEEDDGEVVVNDDEEVEEEVKEEDEEEKELIQKKRRRRRKRGGAVRRRKQREEEKNSENEDDDDNEDVAERGRGRRRRNRRRGRGRESNSRRKNSRRGKQESDEGEEEDEEDDNVTGVSSNQEEGTALESGPSSKPTNRKDRMEHEKKLRAKLAAKATAKESSSKKLKKKGVAIEELDSRARELMIKYTINSKEGENENGEDDVDGDAESDTNVAANLYYAALAKKGISPIIVSKMLKSVTAEWAHKSVNPDIDNVLGMAHLFIHFELLGMAGEMFRDVVSLYRDCGLIVPVDNSPVSHPWSSDTMVQGKNMSPLARAFIGQLGGLSLLLLFITLLFDVFSYAIFCFLSSFVLYFVFVSDLISFSIIILSYSAPYLAILYSIY